MAPLQGARRGSAAGCSGSDAPERIRKRLDVAGNPLGWTVERVQAGKVIGAIALFLVSLALTAVMGAGPDAADRLVAVAPRRWLVRPEPVPLPEGLRPLEAHAARRCPTRST